ncbi:hypothetical protein KOJCDNHJ_00473 [Xanthomonas citri pv. punicae]|nr:hypothetical protein KOJCDNHJ_00473 [Xanthomonas citri pv. punicae]
MTNAGLERACDRCQCVRFIHFRIQVADRGSTEAQCGKLHVGASQPLPRHAAHARRSASRAHERVPEESVEQKLSIATSTIR